MFFLLTRMSLESRHASTMQNCKTSLREMDSLQSLRLSQKCLFCFLAEMCQKKPQLLHQNKWFPNGPYSTLLNKAAIPRTILLVKQPLLAWLCCWELCVIHPSLTLLLRWKFGTQINTAIRSLNQQNYHLSHILFLHMEKACRKWATIIFFPLEY